MDKNPKLDTNSHTGLHTFFKLPLHFSATGFNGGACILDEDGDLVASLFWPIHPQDEASGKQVEKDLAELGNAICAIYE